MTRASAYPLPADVLASRVRKMAADTGEMPSQRHVMKTCHVSAKRAAEAIATVRQELEERQQASTVTALRVVHDDTDERTETHPGDDAAVRTQVHPEVRTPAAEDAIDGAAETAPEGVAGPARRHADHADGNTPEAPTPAISDGPQVDGDALVTTAGETPTGTPARRFPRWPILLIALGAFVSIWGGWVGLGEMAGFGPIRLLPGIADSFVINSAITLPIGVEAYAAYAIWAWLAPPEAQVSERARRFACWSSIAALGLGVFGQATYHLLVTAGVKTAPGPVVVFVSCLPVLVLGAAAALAHLIHSEGPR